MNKTLQLPDMLINCGGVAEIKAVSDGEPIKVSGYLVTFGSEDNTDITAQKDFFTADTYYGEIAGKSVPIYFHHGLPIKVKQEDGSFKAVGPGKRKIGIGTLSVDDTGIFVDAVLDEHEPYAKVIGSLADAKKLGWSSGAPNHLVSRKSHRNADNSLKANEVEQWLVAEASLTHTPAEPVNVASIKSALGDYGDYYTADYAYPKAGSEWKPEREIAHTAMDTVHYRLQRAARNIIASDSMSPDAQREAMSKIHDEAKSYSTGLVLSIANNSYNGGEATKAAESLFADFVPADDLPPTVGESLAGVEPLRVSLADQGESVASTVESYLSRVRTVADIRGVKSGRAISKASRATLESIIKQATELLALDGEKSPAETNAPESVAAPLDALPAADVEAKTLSLTDAPSFDDVQASLAALGIA